MEELFEILQDRLFLQPRRNLDPVSQARRNFQSRLLKRIFLGASLALSIHLP
jgi:hypothetical protein